MESRLRMVLHQGGLPRPEVNRSIVVAGCRFRPDLLIDHVIIEYDGDGHRDRDAFVADLRRQNLLVGAGFVVLRYTGSDVYRRPELIVAQVWAALRGHSRAPSVRE